LPNSKISLIPQVAQNSSKLLNLEGWPIKKWDHSVQLCEYCGPFLGHPDPNGF